MIKNQALKTVIAAAKEHKQFTALVTIIIVSLVVAFASECKAHAEEMHPAVAAKKAKVNKTQKSPTPSAKQASKPVIVKTTDNAREPISFDRDGHVARHDEMTQIMNLVVLPDDLMDVTTTTHHEPVAKDREPFTIVVNIN